MCEETDKLVCTPLDTFEEIFEFFTNPPAWRSLCQELKPERHSNKVIRNMDVCCCDPESITLENPATFCHYDPNEPDIPRHDKDSLPKTLVCHDMANGYHDDAVVQGTSNHYAYTFWNWAAVDIFCYFSHHLVTIPPVSWINVGHAHGAKVIGTIITEWGPGTAFWERVLSTQETLLDTARALKDIAKTLKFDGWLLNVENRISEPEKLLEFVKTLHQLLHEELPNAELIWYDSVTIEGELLWQNQLNNHNRPFFDACDGLFTNYSWRENDVAESAAAAGARRTDVYVGLDVWGRNFYGGGQLNTQQAMKVVWRHGCSAAVFAPAWTHEAVPAGGEDARYRAFLLRDAALWGSLWPYLNTRLPALLPFATTFCRGQGCRRFFYGEMVSPGPWFNLRHMQYQLNSAHGPHVYLVSTRTNLRALHLTPSTQDLPPLPSPRPSSAGDTAPLAPTAPPHSDRCDSSVATVEKRNIGSGNSIESVYIGSNSVDKCNVGTERPPRRKVSFHLAEGTFEAGSDDRVKRSDDEEAAEAPPEVWVDSVEVEVAVRAAGPPEPGPLQVASAPHERACAAPCWEDAFCGGASVALHGGDAAGPRHRTARLLHLALRCAGALCVVAATKRAPPAPAQQLDLLLHVHSRHGHRRRYLLLDEPLDDHACTELESIKGVLSALGEGWRAVRAVPAGARFDALRRHLLTREPGFYVPRDNAFGWNVRYYWIETDGGMVTSIGARCRARRGPALLGHLALCHAPPTLDE